MREMVELIAKAMGMTAVALDPARDAYQLVGPLGWCELPVVTLLAAERAADGRYGMDDLLKTLTASVAAQHEAQLQAAVDHVAEYVALKARIGELERDADEAKAAAVELLQADGAPVGKAWIFPGLATVVVVAGRKSEKLDRARLAKAGVDPAVLDAATVRTEGAPSVRITRADE